jgi:hypothetical protein
VRFRVVPNRPEVTPTAYDRTEKLTPAPPVRHG